MRNGKGTPPVATPLKTIHQIRDEMGLRIEDVAQEGGLSLGTYMRVDRESTNIENVSLGVFIRTAWGLRRSPAELLQDLGLDIKPEF